MGARKMPAMPAAAPHPTRIISTFGDSLKACPMLEPMAAPVNTIGPSAPTDPPNPIVIEDDMTEDHMFFFFSRDLRCEMAYSTRVTPCDTSSLITNFTSSVTIMIPIIGYTRYTQLPEVASRWAVSIPLIAWIRNLSSWAASPHNMPTTRARIIRKELSRMWRPRHSTTFIHHLVNALSLSLYAI